MTGLRVLVVDDDVEFTASVEEILTNRGYRVVTAGTGAEAVSVALAERVGFLLLDLRFPDIEGADIYREIARMTDPTDNLRNHRLRDGGVGPDHATSRHGRRELPVQADGPQKLVEPIERSMR